MSVPTLPLGWESGEKVVWDPFALIHPEHQRGDGTKVGYLFNKEKKNGWKNQDYLSTDRVMIIEPKLEKLLEREKKKSWHGTTDDTGRFHTINIDPDTIDLLVDRNYGKRRFFASLASLLFYSNVGQTIRPWSKGVKQAWSNFLLHARNVIYCKVRNDSQHHCKWCTLLAQIVPAWLICTE